MKDRVYSFLKTVPPGKVVTYGQIAAHLGCKRLSRVVGNILHRNPDPEHIPCHRVVNARGAVSKAYAVDHQPGCQLRNFSVFHVLTRFP